MDRIPQPSSQDVGEEPSSTPHVSFNVPRTPSGLGGPWELRMAVWSTEWGLGGMVCLQIPIPWLTLLLSWDGGGTSVKGNFLF